MTLEDIKTAYNNTILSQKQLLSKLKNKIFRVGTIRLLIVLLTVGGCYLMWSNTLAVVTLIILSIALFLFILKFHNKLFIQKRYCELLIQNAENELKGIDYDYSAFDGAPEKADANHSYSLDLDMFGSRSLFQAINRSVTVLGKNKLADTLLFPFERKDDISAQQEAIKELCEKPELLKHFRAIGQMSETEDMDVNSFSKQFLQKKTLSNSGWKYLSYASPIISVVLIALTATSIIPFPFLGLGWTLLFALSLLPLKSIKEKMNLFEKKLDVLETYSNLFQIIENEKFDSDLLASLQEKVSKNQQASKAIHQLKSHSSNLYQSFTILGFMILNPFFFWNVFYSIKIEKWIKQHQHHLPEWFEVLAKFDSLISFSIYAYNNPNYTYPEVSDTFAFEGKDLGHPMLNRKVCVRNDISIKKHPFFLVVTGANMAGKSTYLRTVGVNLTLACAGAPVCATSLRFYPFKLVTNLRTSDSLTDNESYFFAELKRLKMIIDRLKSGEQLFIILDEILKGTNSEDKQKGSIALMKQLVNLDGNGIIATHDLALGNLESEFPEAIKNYRFEADMQNEQLSFTYKIREGVAQNMNASFLMKKMGITGL